MEKNLFFLIKIGPKKYMEELYNEGTLFMRRLKSYREYGHYEANDTNEGMSDILDLKNIKLNVNEDEIKLKGKGYGCFDFNYNLNPFNYSMYAITTNHLTCIKENLIDEKNLTFGDTAVIIHNIDDYYERIIKYCTNHRVYAKGNLIEYINPYEYEGKLGLFRKSNEYKHQSEWRLLVDNESVEEYIKIKLGSLKSIAYIIPSKDLKKTIKLKR